MEGCDQTENEPNTLNLVTPPESREDKQGKAKARLAADEGREGGGGGARRTAPAVAASNLEADPVTTPRRRIQPVGSQVKQELRIRENVSIKVLSSYR